MTAVVPTPARLWHGRKDWSAVGAWFVRQIEGNAWAWVGAVWGAVMVGWAFSEVWEAHEDAGQKRAAAQAQWSAQGAEVTVPAALDPLVHAGGALWPRLPGRWPPDAAAALRQFLIHQRLQVQALRALPEVAAGSLKGQSVALRMTGAYADWARSWQILSAAGPVLSIERMSVLSLVPSGVQIEVVLHLWSRPGSTFEISWPSDTAMAWASGADIFAAAGPDLPSAEAPTTVREPVAQTDDPVTWPLERIRWLGTWQHGADLRAVLSAGGAWITVPVGQRVSLEGHKVASIGADGVVLRTPQGQRVELKGGGR